MPFSAWNQSETKLKPEAANTLSLMFQIFLEKNYRTPWPTYNIHCSSIDSKAKSGVEYITLGQLIWIWCQAQDWMNFVLYHCQEPKNDNKDSGLDFEQIQMSWPIVDFALE